MTRSCPALNKVVKNKMCFARIREHVYICTNGVFTGRPIATDYIQSYMFNCVFLQLQKNKFYQTYKKCRKHFLKLQFSQFPTNILNVVFKDRWFFNIFRYTLFSFLFSVIATLHICNNCCHETICYYKNCKWAYKYGMFI